LNAYFEETVALLSRMGDNARQRIGEQKVG
jgi:hypothetical protein